MHGYSKLFISMVSGLDLSHQTKRIGNNLNKAGESADLGAFTRTSISHLADGTARKASAMHQDPPLVQDMQHPW